MPKRPNQRKRVSRKGRATGPDSTPERNEKRGAWYYDNIAAEDRHPTPNLPDPPLLWTAAFPDFKQAINSTITAWHRLTGALPVVRRCCEIWEATHDLIAVHREAITAAVGTGYHSTEEVATAISSLPDDAAERRKFYQRLADESHNADRAQCGRSRAWDQLASREFENPLVREMNPVGALLTLLWVSNALWLCDTPTIEGFLTELLGRFDVQIAVKERQIVDEIRRLGLYRYEGRGRLILAGRGPEPDACLREEMRAVLASGNTVKTNNSLTTTSTPEGVESEPEN